MKYKRNNQNKYKKVSCSYCNSKNTVRRGFRETNNRGKIQRYFCKDCKRKFILDEGFFRMRNSSNKITLCLDLFYRGVSTRKIQEHLQAFYPHNSSNVSIYKWVVKYSNMVGNYTDNLKVNSGSEVQIDEMLYTRRKYHKKKGVKEDWFIDMIDCKTRYLVSSEYVSSRGLEEMKRVMKNAKNKTENKVKIVTTDGLNIYPKALRSSFGLNKYETKSKIIHNRVNASKGEGFNIMIERLHNSIRQLTQNFRGFHGSLESAKSIMKGYEIYYNFIRKHQAIGKCPYELATDLELKSNNKWLELIGKSKKEGI